MYDGSPLVPSAEDVGYESLSEGYTFSVTLSGSQTDAGESSCTIASYVIRDSSGRDVTSFCTVITEPGTLTVTPVVISISSPSDTMTYNGYPYPECTDNLSSMPDLCYAWAKGTGSSADAGSYTNDIGYELHVSADQASNYSVQLNPGTITIQQLALTISSSSDSKTYDGYPMTPVETSWIYTSHDATAIAYRELGCDNSNAGTYTNGIEIDFGSQKESNYIITKNPGTFTINKRNVTITSGSADKEYDGSPLTYDYCDFDIDGGTVGDEWFSCTCNGSQTEIGSSNNTFTVTGIGGANLDNYNINKVYGTLTVTAPKPSVTVTVPDRSKTYDGQPFAEQTVEVSEAPGVYYTYPASSDPNVGSTSGYSYTVSGNTDAYHITWANSTVTYTINQYPIVFDLHGGSLDVNGRWALAPASMNGVYADTPLSTYEFTIPNVTPTETIILTTSSSIANENGQIVPLTSGQTYPINYSYRFTKTNSNSDPNYTVTVNNTTYTITGTLSEPVNTDGSYVDPGMFDDPDPGYTVIDDGD